MTTKTLQVQQLQQHQLQLQLQLHYKYTYNYNYIAFATPHYMLQLWVRHCNHSENHNHLSVHQWIRSATHASQPLTSSIVSYLWNFRRRLVRYYWYMNVGGFFPLFPYISYLERWSKTTSIFLLLGAVEACWFSGWRKGGDAWGAGDQWAGTTRFR